MQSACAKLYCHLCPVWLYHIFPHYSINGTIFRKYLLNIKCAFTYSTRYSCHIISKSRCILETSSNIKISWKSVHWVPRCSTRTDGRTDMTKVTVAFRTFADAPKTAKNSHFRICCMPEVARKKRENIVEPTNAWQRWQQQQQPVSQLI